MFLFPVSAAFCSFSGIFLFTFPSPALSPSPTRHPLLSPWGLPCLGPQALVPPLLCTSCFLPGCPPLSCPVCYRHCWCPSTAVLIPGAPLHVPVGSVSNSPGAAGRRTEFVHGHIIDRLSAKFLGRFVFKAVNAYTSLCLQFPGSHAKAQVSWSLETEHSTRSTEGEILENYGLF